MGSLYALVAVEMLKHSHQLEQVLRMNELFPWKCYILSKEIKLKVRLEDNGDEDWRLRSQACEILTDPKTMHSVVLIPVNILEPLGCFSCKCLKKQTRANRLMFKSYNPETS